MLSIQPHKKIKIQKINKRKNEKINPLKNIFIALILFLKSNPIANHECLDCHLILAQLGKTIKNKKNVIIVPIILKSFELISLLNT